MKKIRETLTDILIEQEGHGEHGDAVYIRTCMEALTELRQLENFVEQVFEIAFGDNAINRDFSRREVITRLQEFSDNAWKYEELQK